MRQIPKNHDQLYFDKLCRTQKGESVLSLIHATYHAKNAKVGDEEIKNEIAKRLESAYRLFRDNVKGADNGSGSYTGELDQFDSQYTIGHEMGIWKNSKLDLSKLANEVAKNKITIRDYFDIVFLNYFQPVNEIIVHLLYHLLIGMREMNSITVTKQQMTEIYMKVGNCKKDKNGEINGAFNLLIASNYFEEIDSKTLKYIGKYTIDELIGLCNTTYVKKGCQIALEELDTEAKYIQYLTNDPRKNCVGLEALDGENEDRVTGGKNILLYGVPGSGKSHTIKMKYCNDKKLMERVVFHPDYTYSDFVGQILPRVIDKELKYVFTPGPFTKMIKKAKNNPGEMFYLVIEEINRGNAPAIFGEIFQLLDRNENGTSEYGISNYDIALEVYGHEEHEVTIPSNLTVLATMNTSDQNVFTLDTAFQRRWDMQMIENKIDNAIHADKCILDTDITWKMFNEKINSMIIENSLGMSSSEDKRLGAYFVKEDEIVFDENENSEISTEKELAHKNNSKFPEKVIKYLWDDVFKYNRDDIFKEKYKSLEEIVCDFKNAERFNVFKIDFHNEKNNTIKDLSNDSNTGDNH